MKMSVYTIYDVASGVYMRPFFAKADGEAMRSFADLAVDPQHPVGAHPSDYTLFNIGSYDDNTGQIQGGPPLKLMTALEGISAVRNADKRQLDLIEEGDTNDEES